MAHKPSGRGGDPLFSPTLFDKMKTVAAVYPMKLGWSGPTECRHCNNEAKFRVEYKTTDDDSPIYYTFLCAECADHPQITLAMLRDGA